MEQAVRKGKKSSGNAKGTPGNAGNAEAKGNPKNAGNASAEPAVSQKVQNLVEEVVTTGQGKIKAGKRSGLRRQAKATLKIKEPWLTMILEGRKVWEIRGETTKKRGWIHLTRSGASGEIHGSATLLDVHSLTRRNFAANFDKHRIRDVRKVKYAKIYAWELTDAN